MQHNQKLAHIREEHEHIINELSVTLYSEEHFYMEDGILYERKVSCYFL